MNQHTSIPIRAYVETDEDRAEAALEAAWEANREDCLAEFDEWQRADYAAREFEDFGNWLANKARWNGGGKYLKALSWKERGGFL